MPSTPSNSLVDILLALTDAGVEFVLVGGLAAVSQGAPLTTFDVDIVQNRTNDNLDRLMHVLTSIHAYYRGRPGDRLPPDPRALAGPGHSLFMTDLGPLDVLGEIEGRRDYDELLEHAITVELSGRSVNVLSLELLLEMKRASHHPKDQQAVRVLEATLARRKG